jgi:predicted Zn-dependent protease
MSRGGRIATALGLVLVLAGQVWALGLSEEQTIGARFALEARRQLPLLREPTVSAYVRRLGARLVARLDNEQFTYRFFVLRDAALNAFAVPGGAVYVHTGLITGARSEAELAGVLAHEVVHVDAHHVVRQQERTALLSYGTLLGLFLSAVHPALGASAVAAGTAAQLKYQREFEQEADHVGLDLMQRAGFDPEGMPAFLRQVLGQQRLGPDGVPPYFLSHPLTEDRVGQLEQRVATMTRPAASPDAALALATAQATIRVTTEGRATVIAHYRTEAEAHPESVVQGYLLGLVYLHAEQPERALPLLAAAREAVPWARADHARALARTGAAAAARTEFVRYLERAPDDAVAELDLGRLLVAAEEHASAVPRLRHALALDPELDDAEYALAECLGKTGDAYGQWWHLGRAYELRGDIERATNAYERARDRAAEGSDDYTQAVQALRMLRETFGGAW